jgi:hypothetical protein
MDAFDARFARLQPRAPIPNEIEVRPPSSNERQAWSSSLGMPRTFAFVEQATELVGPLNTDALGRAIGALSQRFDILRTSYSQRDGELVAVVDPSVVVPMRFVDCTDDGGDRAQAELDRERNEGFDLSKAPLSRALLLRLGPDRHRFYLFSHHIQTDGQSDLLLQRSTNRLYRAFAAGETPALPQPRLQYRDYAHWQQEEFTDEIRAEYAAFFAQHLPPRPPPQPIAAMTPRPPGQWRFSCSRVGVNYDLELSRAIVEIARVRNTVPAVVLLAALHATLQLEGAGGSTIGMYSANRRRETIGICGLFTTLVPHHASFAGSTTFGTAIDYSRDAFTALSRHQELAPSFSAPDGALPYRVTLNYWPTYEGSTYDFDGVQAIDLASGGDKPHCIYDIEPGFYYRSDDTLRQFVRFNGELIAPAQMDAFLARFGAVLRDGIADPSRRIDKLGNTIS